MDDNKPNFVFLNTTNAPALSPEATRRMRRHITKSNFAKRRQRIAENPKTNSSIKQKKKCSKKRLKGNTDVVLSSGTKHNQDLQLLILLTCLNPPTPNNPSEAAWVDLIASEPALVEATMAVGMRHWSPEALWQWQADVCSSKALQSVIQQISCQQTDTDGFLAAIMTMAFSARLAHTDDTWDVHIEGLVQIISERRGKGIKEPEWFCDVLVLDAVNYIFNFPRFYHKRVIDAVSDYGGLRLRQVAEISEGIMTLRKAIDMYHMGHQIDPQTVAKDIKNPLARLRERTQKLQRTSKRNKYVYATALTLELILCLLWPSESESACCYNLAKELQQTTSQFPKMPCPYMDLTSCQFIIGAVAAEDGSSTKMWFVDKLTGAARAMQDRGWGEEPFEILRRMLGADGSLRGWFEMEGGGRDGMGYGDVSRRILGVSLCEGCVAV